MGPAHHHIQKLISPPIGYIAYTMPLHAAAMLGSLTREVDEWRYLEMFKTRSAAVRNVCAAGPATEPEEEA